MVAGHQPDGNTYVLESAEGLTVFDTDLHAAHLREVLKFAADKHAPIIAVISSHWHLDHVSGNLGLRKVFPDIEAYASWAINDALTGFLAKSAESSRKLLADGKLSPVQQEEIERDLATIGNGEALKPDVVRPMMSCLPSADESCTFMSPMMRRPPAMFGFSTPILEWFLSGIW
jgi:glyoxylase-like metal-dependent hydrolase (beta-lactamase superfamily II)